MASASDYAEHHSYDRDVDDLFEMGQRPLRPCRVPAAQLHYDPQTRTYVGEVSDLGASFGRVYRDACDVGLTIIGRTSEVTFVINRTERRDGEVVAWHLIPAHLADRKLNVTVTIFND